MPSKVPKVDGEVGEVYDEVRIPKRGFLTKRWSWRKQIALKQIFFPCKALPTYKRRKTLREWGDKYLKPFKITILHIIYRINSNYWKSRLLLYEIARLERGPFAIIRHGRLKLAETAQALDKEIYQGMSELKWESAVREKPRVFDKVLENEKFKNGIVESERMLRGLEKEFRDTMNEQLKARMVYKKNLDLQKLLSDFQDIHSRIMVHCENVRDMYNEVQKEILVEDRSDQESDQE
ncbi:hypothetical protein IQ07DRAFT_593023 [Pyrenochaeta sp. DS3sAY3a]|nr:hypothetical protein IQ07DRAFT_593023 [Pyrenochaeta sp. DS3sAY3a]